MSAAEKIKNAMTFLMGSDDPLTGELAVIMTICLQQGSLDFQTVVAQSGDNASEVLLLAWDWKLLIPRRSMQCAEWDDRVLKLVPGEFYDMVNVIHWLVTAAAKTGSWPVDDVLRRLYASMGEPAFEQIPTLVREIVRLARYQRITGAGMQTACTRSGLQDRTGAMIAILKGGGVISPNLRTGNPMEKTKSPLYDIHPVLVHLYSEAGHAP